MKIPRASFFREGDFRTLLASFLYFDISFMVWVSLGALGNFIADDFGLTGTQKGLMTALPVLSGALLRLPMGVAADRFGGKRVGLAGLTLTLLPLGIGWLAADRLEVLYLVGLLLGVAGGSFGVALPLASRCYPPERQGLALGIVGAGNSGTVLASLFAPRLAESFGWQAVFGLAMIPVATVLGIFTILAQPRKLDISPPGFREVARLVRRAEALWFCFVYAVTFGGFVGLTSYLAVFFRDQFGLSNVRAGDLTAICAVAGSLSRPVGGLLADRLGGASVLVTALALVGATMVLVSTVPPIELSGLLLVGSMALLGLGNGAVFQLVPQRFGREVGVVTGLVGVAGGLGGFLLPFVLGFMRERSGLYGPGFALFALVALLASALVVTVWRRWARAPLGNDRRFRHASAEPHWSPVEGRSPTAEAEGR